MSEYIKKDDALRKAIVVKVYLDNGNTVGDAPFEWINAIPVKKIESIPAADVEPVVRATWQDGKCTNCDCYGFPTYDGDNERTAFCSHCGAHMERSGSGERREKTADHKRSSILL